MGVRSGSLGNGGFDTGFFLPETLGALFSLKSWGWKFMELASQSVFISDDDHMLYGFKESTSSAQWSFGLST